MAENVHVHGSSSEHDWPCARLPLNSKRLSTEQIKQVRRALGTPTGVAVNEVRVMIEGKLREMDRDPTNVQVVMSATSMSLWGEDGEFLSIAELPPTETSDFREDEQDSKEHSESGDSRHKTEQLRTELQEARAEIQMLRGTISSLQTQVNQGKDYIR